MSFSAAKNRVLHERCKAYAVAMQNLREEGARLRDIFLQEAKPGGVADAAFVDTEIATTAEIVGIIDYAADFKSLNESVAVGAAGRGLWLLPLVDTTPA